VIDVEGAGQEKGPKALLTTPEGDHRAGHRPVADRTGPEHLGTGIRDVVGHGRPADGESDGERSQPDGPRPTARPGSPPVRLQIDRSSKVVAMVTPI